MQCLDVLLAGIFTAQIWQTFQGDYELSFLRRSEDGPSFAVAQHQPPNPPALLDQHLPATYPTFENKAKHQGSYRVDCQLNYLRF
jgi:hypothetical protein